MPAIKKKGGGGYGNSILYRDWSQSSVSKMILNFCSASQYTTLSEKDVFVITQKLTQSKHARRY